MVEMLDSTGNLRLRHGISLGEFCAIPGGVDFRVFSAAVPLPLNAVTLRFSIGQVTLRELSLTRDEPTIVLKWRPPTEVEGVHSVHWESRGEDLFYVLHYRHAEDRTWQPISLRTTATSMAIDFDRLPGGENCRLAVVASNGVRNARAETAPFAVPVKAVIPLIIAPADGESYAAGVPIAFRGQGFDLQTGSTDEEITWASSLDGIFGRGRAVDAGGLTVGEHEIELTAGRRPKQGSARIKIRVMPSPATDT
jgi:hypothetical protein